MISFLAIAYLTLDCYVAKCILHHLREKAASTHARSIARFSFALESAVVSFRDQRLATSMSTIVWGLSQLEWGMSICHFQNVGNLAWFSITTCILTFTVLKGKFQVQPNPVMKIIRVVIMGCLLVLLICVMASFGYLSWARIILGSIKKTYSSEE